MKQALLIIAKRPAAGQTKTRLCPPLLPEQAADLYAAFLQDTIIAARRVQNVTRLLLYLPHDERAYFAGLAPDFGLLPQRGHSLGARLDAALTECLQQGFERVVVMDSDSPTLPDSHVSQAFHLLGQADVVLGPCDDGGYYLIGLTRPQPGLLHGVQMSTPTVLRDTLALAERQGLRVALLPSWYDVDTPPDLQRLRLALAADADGTAPNTRALLQAGMGRGQP